MNEGTIAGLCKRGVAGALAHLGHEISDIAVHLDNLRLRALLRISAALCPASGSIAYPILKPSLIRECCR